MAQRTSGTAQIGIWSWTPVILKASKKITQIVVHPNLNIQGSETSRGFECKLVTVVCELDRVRRGCGRARNTKVGIPKAMLKSLANSEKVRSNRPTNVPAMATLSDAQHRTMAANLDIDLDKETGPDTDLRAQDRDEQAAKYLRAINQQSGQQCLQLCDKTLQ